MPPGGYFGKALLVGLKTGSSRAEPIEEPVLRSYLGGAGRAPRPRGMRDSAVRRRRIDLYTPTPVSRSAEGVAQTSVRHDLLWRGHSGRIRELGLVEKSTSETTFLDQS